MLVSYLGSLILLQEGNARIKNYCQAVWCYFEPGMPEASDFSAAVQAAKCKGRKVVGEISQVYTARRAQDLPLLQRGHQAECKWHFRSLSMFISSESAIGTAQQGTASNERVLSTVENTICYTA